MSFSSGGGTLALPSPTHPHHVDVSSAVRSLRRSLSRSPSKFSPSRTSSQGSECNPPGPQSPGQSYRPGPNGGLQSQQAGAAVQGFDPPPANATAASTTTPTTTPTSSFLSSISFTSLPPVAHSSSNIFANTTPAPQAFSTPVRPSARLSLRSIKPNKNSQLSRPLPRSRITPRSPSKRILLSSSGCGNSKSAAHTSFEGHGQENSGAPLAAAAATTTVANRSLRSLDTPSRHSLHLDISGSSHYFKSPPPPHKSESAPYSASPSGPLKRTDAMSLDQTEQGSPVAKRRSLHGVAPARSDDLDDVHDRDHDHDHDMEFTIFDQASPQAHDNHDASESTGQDYELVGSDNYRGLLPSPSPSPSPTPIHGASGRRQSLLLRRSALHQRHGDRGSSWGRRSGAQRLAQMGVEPSTPAPSRPRLSMDNFNPTLIPRESPFTNPGPLPNPSAHPIEKPPHPLSKTLTPSASGNSLVSKQGEQAQQAPVNFSKSLPYGVGRPAHPERPESDGLSTPRFEAKPWQGAFHSTGLISKVNRHPELAPERAPIVPDTPCKAQPYPRGLFNTFPQQLCSTAKKDGRTLAGASTPETPLKPSATHPNNSFGKPGKGLGLFSQFQKRTPRRGSILDGDADEPRSLFACEPDDQVPPTPTRPTPRQWPAQADLESPSTDRLGRSTASRDSAGKLLVRSPREEEEVRNGGSASASPYGLKRGPTSEASSVSSFGRLRAMKGLTAPSLLQAAVSLPPANPTANAAQRTKHTISVPVSPLARKSPHTPSALLPGESSPTDPGCLAVSKKTPGGLFPSPKRLVTPVTPNARQDPQAGLTTPVNFRSGIEVDGSLISRFSRIEPVGQGEFSSVFKVVSLSGSNRSILDAAAVFAPSTERVYAVKKTRHPYHGVNDRENKLKEAVILRNLSYAKHVVHYVDSWEENNHLYIQTEFCDEGTLEGFLREVGITGRLDDFRVWKILHDLALGLQEIHDANYMHLDLKPANVLVTFEGVLKIADFGLALPWPASAGVDAEGDREYIGPEVLQGRVDKASDIFALGLMLMEMSCNVYLPHNGSTWTNLRSGHLAEVPPLTLASQTQVLHDASGAPVVPGLSELASDFGGSRHSRRSGPTSRGGSRDALTTSRRSELLEPPGFMADMDHPGSLDQVFRSMVAPDPVLRLTVRQLLQTEGLVWVAGRRQSPATVYEGYWGPTDVAVATLSAGHDGEDMVMTDV